MRKSAYSSKRWKPRVDHPPLKHIACNPTFSPLSTQATIDGNQKMDPSLNNPPAGDAGPGSTQETVVKIDIAPRTTTAVRGKDVKSVLGQPGRLSQPAEPAAVSDDVQLTDTAERLRQLESSMGSVEISDSAKIESIRQAIADGNFKVDEEVVAENLVQESISNISQRASLINP